MRNSLGRDPVLTLLSIISAGLSRSSSIVILPLLEDG
jgi:hypothetical protein